MTNRRATTADGIRFWQLALLRVIFAAGWCASGSAQQGNGTDYLHGRQQVLRMLSDRPAMGVQLVENDPLVAWAAAQFAGSRTGRRIWWDPEPPVSGVDASHQWSEKPSVRVHPIQQAGPSSGRRKGFSDSWADILFELHNIAQSPVYEAAWQDLLDHRLTAPQWLEILTRGEHRALLYTQAFHRTRWRIWMRARGAPPTSTRWAQIAETPSDYLSWIARYAHGRGYPYRDYLPGYRRAMRHSELFGLHLDADPFSLDALFQPDAIQP